MTHTPGPWKAIKEKWDIAIIGSDEDYIAYVPVEELVLPEESDNAILISLAPDLLEACQLALIELDRIGSDIGFEPERYQERINALDALSRAVRKAGE